MKKKLKKIGKILWHAILALIGIKYPKLEEVIEETTNEIRKEVMQSLPKRPRNKKGQFIKKT